MARQPRFAIPPVPTKPMKPQALKVQAVSAKERLIWQRFVVPAQAAIAQQQAALGVAQELIVEHMMEGAGLDRRDGWKLNVDTMQWEQHPVPSQG